WSFVMTRRELPDETAYRLARALHRGEAALGTRLTQARETTAANTALAAPRPDLIHPGVRPYLAQLGLLPHPRPRAHAPGAWARSSPYLATTSQSLSGARSVLCPGPYSVGRGTNAVRMPCDRAAARS